MADTFTKENVPDMSWDDIVSWHSEHSAPYKTGLETYVIWVDGFKGEGDFFHRNAEGNWSYSHTVNYHNPQPFPVPKAIVDDTAPEPMPVDEDDPAMADEEAAAS